MCLWGVYWNFKTSEDLLQILGSLGILKNVDF